MGKRMVAVARFLPLCALLLLLPAIVASQLPPPPPPPPPELPPTPSPTPTPRPNQSPVITLLGEDPLVLPRDCPFTDPGATATDVEDGDLTKRITVTGLVSI